jgi:DNA-binding response OmpR family regulator
MHKVTLSPLVTVSGNQETTEAVPSGQRPCVCLIEHVTSTRHILENFLKQEGFTVEAFACGIEALRSFAHAHSRTPDVLVLDIDGPGMNGYGLLQCFKSMSCSSQTHVLVLSRFDGVMERLLSRLAGASGYLVKPVSSQMVLSTLNASLRPVSSDLY